MIGLEPPDCLSEHLGAGIAIGNIGKVSMPTEKTVTPRKLLNGVRHPHDLHHVTDGYTAPVQPTDAADNDQQTAWGPASIGNAAA